MVDQCLQVVIENSPVVDVTRRVTRDLANLEKRRSQCRQEQSKDTVSEIPRMWENREDAPKDQSLRFVSAGVR